MRLQDIKDASSQPVLWIILSEISKELVSSMQLESPLQNHIIILVFMSDLCSSFCSYVTPHH